jgi:hypothetical protein
LALGANCTATLPNYTSLATTGDNCGVQSVTQSPAAGTTVSGAGNMTVTLTVTDVNGLTNSCTFTVTKVDQHAADDHLSGHADFSAWRKLHGHLAQLHQLSHNRRQLRRSKCNAISGSRNFGFRRRQHDRDFDRN